MRIVVMPILFIKMMSGFIIRKRTEKGKVSVMSMPRMRTFSNSIGITDIAKWYLGWTKWSFVQNHFPIIPSLVHCEVIRSRQSHVIRRLLMMAFQNNQLLDWSLTFKQAHLSNRGLDALLQKTGSLSKVVYQLVDVSEGPMHPLSPYSEPCSFEQVRK